MRQLMNPSEGGLAQSGRARRRHSKKRPLRRFAASAVAALPLAAGAGCSDVRLDENLCPRDRAPARTTLLLLDTSDPLTPKHRAELRRLVGELQDPAADLPVAPGEKLIAYEIGQDLNALKPVLEVCNPGEHPDEWEWWQQLTRGRAIDMQRWYRFRERLEALFDQIEARPAQTSSPILETLSVIVPRHAQSRRAASSRRAAPTHLIVFSDLLQHSETLSHYGAYPEAEAIRKTPGLSALQTNLAGVALSLYRLERGRDARWQTRGHYYWWTGLAQSFDATLVWQESI